MKQPFESVRERLLRAGVAPRHVNRYVTELDEHLADLATQERAAGHDAAQADARAKDLLGSDAQLAEAMIERGAPLSLAARAPWAVFALGPVATVLVVTLATAVLMMFLLGPVRGLAPSEMAGGYRSLIATVSFVSSYLIGPLLVAGCIAIALRQRLQSRWVWIGLGLIALVSAPLGFHMHFVPSAGAGSGVTSYSLTGIVYLQGRPDVAATLSLAAMRAAALFALSVVVYRILQLRLAR
jgi:outer membrane murein-binding lipoprotein Lpp